MAFNYDSDFEEKKIEDSDGDKRSIVHSNNNDDSDFRSCDIPMTVMETTPSDNPVTSIEMVLVPPIPTQEFKSWDDFKFAIEEYCASTYQIFK